MTIEHVEKVYNRYSGVYDLIFGPVFNSGREIAPRLLDLAPGERLLEVGVGTGLSLPKLPRNIHSTGIDLSEKMLDQARKRVNGDRPDVEFIRMDATHLEFADDAFDAVLAAYFISTVPDPVRVVHEMKRVCKPGGRLVFLNHFLSENALVGAVEKVISPFCYRIGFATDLNLRKLMADCGLAIETLEPIDFMGNWKAVRCVNPE